MVLSILIPLATGGDKVLLLLFSLDVELLNKK